MEWTMKGESKMNIQFKEKRKRKAIFLVEMFLFNKMVLVKERKGMTWLKFMPKIYIFSLTSCFLKFSPVVIWLLSHVQLIVTPLTATCQAPLSSTTSQSLFKFMSIKCMTLSNHHILCCPLLLLPSNFLSIRVYIH